MPARMCARAQSGRPVDQSDIHAYDHIDLPPIRPIITRINRHRGVCPCCRKPVAAPAPAGLEPGSPFRPGIGALILHLHITQAVSFERLARLMAEVFGLTISEGDRQHSGPRGSPATGRRHPDCRRRARQPRRRFGRDLGAGPR
jgi:hypothetical protein